MRLDNSSGELVPREDFRFDLDLFFVTNKELNFTTRGLVPNSDEVRLLVSARAE